MFTGILKTDGGPHSHEQLAYATGSMLANAFEVKSDSPNFVAIEMAKDEFRVAVTKIMLKHHKEVQDAEREHLCSDSPDLDKGHDRLCCDLCCHELTEVEEAVAEIKEATKPLLAIVQNKEVVPVNPGTFEQVSFDDHLLTIIRQRVEMDLHTTMLIERQWHADRHPDTEQAKIFRGEKTADQSPNLIV